MAKVYGSAGGSSTSGRPSKDRPNKGGNSSIGGASNVGRPSRPSPPTSGRPRPSRKRPFKGI